MDTSTKDTELRQFAIQARRQLSCSIVVVEAALNQPGKAFGVLAKIMKAKLLMIVGDRQELDDLAHPVDVKTVLISGLG